MIRALSSLLSLLSRTPALNLAPSAFARRRLEKSSIYLFRKWPGAMVAAGSVASACASDNSDNSANRSISAVTSPIGSVAAVNVFARSAENSHDG